VDKKLIKRGKNLIEREKLSDFALLIAGKFENEEKSLYTGGRRLFVCIADRSREEWSYCDVQYGIGIGRRRNAGNFYRRGAGLAFG